MFAAPGDALRPPRRQVSGPTSPTTSNPPSEGYATERQRSSSFSDATPRGIPRANTVNDPFDHRPPSRTAAAIPFRRTSGGGTGTALSGGSNMSQKGSSIGLGRRDSSRAPFRSPPPGSSSGTVPTLRSLESYNARNVAAALEPGTELRQIDDVWQTICVRVLPLFNGEGIRGFVEDLNGLLVTHVQRTFARCQSTTRSRYQTAHTPSLDLSSLVTGLLIADLTELIRIGCTTLSTKLSPLAPAQPLADDQLLSRLNEVWLFFYTGILPHLEAVFWVVRSDERLRAAVGGTGPQRADELRTGYGEGRIDVRRIALIEFRDQILHPEMERLLFLFSELYRPLEPSSSDSSIIAPANLDSSFSASSALNVSRSRSQPRRSAGSSTTSPTRSSLFPQHSHRRYSSPPRTSPDPSISLATFPSATLRPPPISPGATSSSSRQHPALTARTQSLARRRQMIAILASLLTNDDRQSEMDACLRLIRPTTALGKQQQQFRRRRRERSRRQSSAAGGLDQEDEDDDAAREGGGGGAGEGPGVRMGGPGGDVGDARVLFDEPAELSDVSPQIPHDEPPLFPLPVVRTRQRQRTMDSLDEERVSDPSASASAHYGRQGSESPLLDVSEGATPTSPAAPMPSSSTAETKKSRRRSLIPRFGKSDSTGSSVSHDEGGGGGGAASEEDAASIATTTTSGGGGGGGGADKLRRGLLRRNSSRKAVELCVMGVNALTMDDE
ncbi:hypothetical protein JCM1841_005546 [Sporobolomyces salmonicolor]